MRKEVERRLKVLRVRFDKQSVYVRDCDKLSEEGIILYYTLESNIKQLESLLEYEEEK